MPKPGTLSVNPRGGQVGNVNALKHGHYARSQAVKDGRMDRRSAVYRRIQKRIAEYRRALGREISPQKLTLLTDIARTEVLLLEPLDLYLSRLSGPISKGRPRPAVLLRLQLANHIKDGLMKVGLGKVKRIKSPWAKAIYSLFFRRARGYLYGFNSISFRASMTSENCRSKLPSKWSRQST